MNARALSDRGAAVLVKDERAREELGDAVLKLIGDANGREHLRSAMQRMGMSNAAETIAMEVIRLARSDAFNAKDKA
jgi:UDP-N-acetylglucosamine:LPS N-acetylglucosamine transferase